MKKLTTLVLAAGLVVSSFAGAASAAEFKPFAQFAQEFSYGDAGKNIIGATGNGLGGAENFQAATRIRFGFDYIASEDLSATMLFQYRHNWGKNVNDAGTGLAISADPSIVESGDQFRMRLAYIDWTIPTTEVKARMGRHAVVAPSYAFGSAILDSRADGITVSGAVNDNISLGFSWLRLASDIKYDGTAITPTNGFKAQDDADALMLQAEFAYDGWKVAPWAIYAHKQENAALWTSSYPYGADAWVIGVSGELSMFDPFVFAVDALYNSIGVNNTPVSVEDTYDAWYIGAKASYKFSNGTASLGGWYASGADYRANQINDKAMMVLDGGFAATDITFDGSIVGADAYYDLSGNDTPFGTWGVILEYADFSFIDRLTHTARVAYIGGTSQYDANRASHDLFEDGLSEDDSIVEINFNSTYEIYKNFAATLQLGYAIVDQDLAAGQEEQDDVFRSALVFVYNF